MPQQNQLTVLGWPCTITVGNTTWHNDSHTPSTSTGTLWYQHNTVRVHLPAELGGPKDLEGYIQVSEKKYGTRRETVTSAIYRNTGIINGEFGLISLVKWLLEQNGISPKQMAKR